MFDPGGLHWRWPLNADSHWILTQPRFPLAPRRPRNKIPS
jgi:hypothetical protein